MDRLDERYTLRRRLDTGGDLSQWEAVRDEDGATVLVERLEEDSPAARGRFHRLRTVLRALRTQGFLDLIDVVARPGAYYAVRESRGWTPLLDHLAQHPHQRQALVSEAAELFDTLLRLGLSVKSVNPGLAVDARGRLYLPRIGLSEERPEDERAAENEAYLESLARVDTGRTPRSPRRPAPAGEGPHLTVPVPRPNKPASKGTGSVIRGWLPVLIAVLALTALGREVVVAVFDVPEVTVPAVVGLNRWEAADRLRAAGLEVEFDAREDARAPADQVLFQTPEEGATVKQGRAVRIVVNATPPAVAVPRLIGLEVTDAEAQLQRLGLTLGRRATVHLPAGGPPRTRVVEQVPPAGTTLPRGGRVDLLVSLGPAPRLTFLPDLTGLPLDQAEYLINLANLVLAGTEEVSAPYRPTGQVLSQSLPANRQVPVGTPVSLQIASGDRHLVTVPDVTLLPVDSATRRLEAAGLVPGDLQTAFDPTKGPVVLDQSPGPGALVARGARVSLIVNATATEIPSRLTPFAFTLEAGLPRSEVSVRVTDSLGTREWVRRTLEPGETLRGTLEVYGEARIRVFLNGNFFREYVP